MNTIETDKCTLLDRLLAAIEALRLIAASGPGPACNVAKATLQEIDPPPEE
jgi:hypothetical protein